MAADLIPGEGTTYIPVDTIKVGDRVRTEMGDIRSLAESIADGALLHAIVITPKRVLVAGGRRLAAVKSLGWSEVPVRVVDISSAADALRAESDENTCREPLRPTEAAEMRRRRAEALAPIAAERKAETQAKPGERVGGSKLDPPRTPRAPVGKTRKVAAIGTGFSGSTLDKVDEVKHIAESPATPEPVKKVAAEAIKEMDATGHVDGPYRRTKEAEIKESAPQPNPAITEIIAKDQGLQDSRYMKAFLKALRSGSDMFGFDAERVGRLCTPDELISVEHHLKSATTFVDKMRKARSGLRVINGGQR